MSPSLSNIPSTFGFFTYKDVRRLGRGAFGEVVLSRVVETGEVVVLKHVVIRDGGRSGLPNNVVREIKALQTIDHPNVVTLRDVFGKGSSIVLVQEYCVTDLAALLQSLSHRLPERLIKGLLAQMLRGLKACHDAGILHRDVKPSNILVNASGVVKLCDFGLSRPHDGGDRPCYTHTVATRWYRAPELLYGARCYGLAVDMWALGCVFAEMLGLCPLIPGDSDIDQLAKMVSLLGSMEPQWPGVTELPDWGKVTFPAAQGTPLADLLPDASPAAIQLLTGMLRYDPAMRILPHEALVDPFFLSPPPAASPDEVARLVASQLGGGDKAF